MTTSRLATACDPTQWVQSLIATNVHVNKETYQYAIIKTFLQGGLSAVTAVICIPACGTEIIKLVTDISCKATGGAIRVVQYINPAWLESFYQIVSTRPNLSYRVERIIGQAFGFLVSAFGIFLRNDWAVQQHQSLGNYIPSKTSPRETSEGAAPPPASEIPRPVPAPPPPPSAKANPTPLKSALKASRAESQAQPPADDTGFSPPSDPTPPSEGQAASAEPSPNPSSASAAASSEGKKSKKKGVRIVSTPTTDDVKPPSSLLDEIRRKGVEQSSKGEAIAATLQKDENARQGTKPLSAEGKAVSEAITATKKKTRRIQSAYFEDYKEGLGRPIQGSMILRDLQKELGITFSEDDTLVSKTFGEYIRIKFEENNTPIEIAEKCELNDCWDKKFTIEIMKIGKDTETGKDIILQAAVDWNESS